MNKIVSIVVLLVALCAGGVWMWSQRSGYDYEAAFENLPAADSAADWPLADFAGKPREEAERVLGRPLGCEAALHSRRCRYAAGVEVVYIDDHADWITIGFPYGRYPLDAQALQRLGLPVQPPTEEDAHSLVWRELPGLQLIRLVGDENGALYARIQVSHG
ncbi:hypothetical protein [Sinimarinibacterium flocculans]|uniref:Uncharacterized protein n=1 Tax=Sinimarinibacterium flocculans TaxID=985250 RepID=A0A318EE97_9GAMM|nr:hypothetical protein [Sinimarinibacterium flocculans]PXV71087.1 hypothetical protein C8D93_101126 [Sinimarinibacterium flocculans]